MTDRYNICYFGLDSFTFSILCQDKSFKLIGINLIQDFISWPTLNPIDWLFKLIYKLRKEELLRPLEILLLQAWKICYPFSSHIYYKYSSYLIETSQKRVRILDLNNSSASNMFLSEKCDLAIVNNWWVLPDEIIYAPKYKTVNIHPSRLPQYAGSLPTLWSLKNHDAESAVSYIILNSKIDEGAIISQHIFKINVNDDAIAVEVKIEQIIKTTLVADLLDYLKGQMKQVNQDMEKKSTTGKYYPYMKINWDKEVAEDIYNKVILYPYLWPLDICFLLIKDKKIVVKRLKIVKKETHITSGFKLVKTALFIQCRKGQVLIKLFKDVGFYDSIWLLFNYKSLNKHYG